MNATPLASNKRWPLWLGLAGLAIVTYLLAHSKADFDAYANSHSGSDSSSPPSEFLHMLLVTPVLHTC